MASAAIATVVLSLAALAAWRTLRRGKHDYCSLCSCSSCPRRGKTDAPCNAQQAP